MNPEDEPVEPVEPIDPPDNTGGGTSTIESDLTAAPAIDPPDNTGGG